MPIPDTAGRIATVQKMGITSSTVQIMPAQLFATAPDSDAPPHGFSGRKGSAAATLASSPAVDPKKVQWLLDDLDAAAKAGINLNMFMSNGRSANKNSQGTQAMPAWATAKYPALTRDIGVTAFCSYVQARYFLYPSTSFTLPFPFPFIFPL